MNNIYGVWAKMVYKIFTVAKNAPKTDTLTVRITPNFKKALRQASIRERRSITNMIEVLILDYYIKNGIDIDE